jgi:hypothetical protein
VVGSATQCDSDRHDYDRIFPLARPAPTPPPPPQEDDDMAKPILLQKSGDHRVLYTDGVTAWHVPTPTVHGIIRQLGAAHVVLPANMAPLWDALWTVRTEP